MVTTTECSVCFEKYENPNHLPKVLNCGHTACLECLRKKVKRNKIPCPECRQETTVPEGGVDKFITVFALLVLSVQPMCGVHKQEEIKLFCSDCNVGVCLICKVSEHKDHHHVYPKNDETRRNVLDKLSSENVKYHQKIREFGKICDIIDQTSTRLETDLNVALQLINTQMETKIKELKETAERKSEQVKNKFGENQRKLRDDKSKIVDVCNSLESRFNTTPQSPDSTTLQLLETLPKIQELVGDAESQDIEVAGGIESGDWEVKDCKISDDILGDFVARPFYIPEVNDFRFDYNTMKKNNIIYYSEGKFQDGELTWRMNVEKFDDGYLGIYTELRSDDNPGIESCNVDRTVTLLNSDSDKSMIKQPTNTVFKTVGNSWGWKQFILWETIVNPTEGFIDKHGIFTVKLHNIIVNEIVRQ